MGVTKYLFWPGTTWASRFTSTHHFWTIPLVVWTTGGILHLAALPLSVVAVAVNVALSRYMTPLSIQFKDKKEVLYLNLNMAHEVWTDIQFQFLLVGQETVPYAVRLLIGWSICNTAAFAFLYAVSALIHQFVITSC